MKVLCLYKNILDKKVPANVADIFKDTLGNIECRNYQPRTENYRLTTRYALSELVNSIPDEVMCSIRTDSHRSFTHKPKSYTIDRHRSMCTKIGCGAGHSSINVWNQCQPLLYPCIAKHHNTCLKLLIWLFTWTVCKHIVLLIKTILSCALLCGRVDLRTVQQLEYHWVELMPCACWPTTPVLYIFTWIPSPTFTSWSIWMHRWTLQDCLHHL